MRCSRCRKHFANVWRSFRETPGVVNWHEHVWFDESGKLDEARLDQMMEHSAMLGVDSLVISLPVIWGRPSPRS